MAVDIIARGMITNYTAGTNINFTENSDGTVEISASGSVSSNDSVARDAINNHKSDTSNPHNVTPSQIGLDKVDNTSDADKPISTAMQQGLDKKAEKNHVHTISEISDMPSSLPANGGNSDTVNNHIVNTDVPENAVFTDTWRGIQDNLTSDSTEDSLSANQGKVLNEKIEEHTDNSDIHVTMRDKENWNSHPTDITASGNPISLDGLQGGVPFADITVSGDDIVGQDLTVGVSGKNLLKYPYYSGDSLKVNNVEFTANADGTLHIKSDGAVTAKSVFWFESISSSFVPPQNTPMYISTSDNAISNMHIGYGLINGNTWISSKGIPLTGSNVIFDYANYDIVVVNITVDAGDPVDVTLYPQLELGNAKTDYEPYHGTEYTITPDSNPYTIPNDIRQYDGLNNISVSAGELSVTGIRKNAAIKSIWDNMGMDLLFDGVTDESNPAVFDLTGYKTIEINHIIISNEKAYPVVIRMSIDNYLATPSTIISPIHASSISTAHNENGNISSLYAVSADGSVMTNTKIYGIK